MPETNAPKPTLREELQAQLKSLKYKDGDTILFYCNLSDPAHHQVCLQLARSFAQRGCFFIPLPLGTDLTALNDQGLKLFGLERTAGVKKEIARKMGAVFPER